MAGFPGGVALSELTVYDWEAADGCAGGTPHLHTASSEGYVVVAGAGAVQTLSSVGREEHPLAPGDIVSFTPGTVHRLINGGDLRLLVVMSNAGLPEAGDAVMTFPDDVLADPEAYARAAALPAGGSDDARAAAARARRDLALEGYASLCAAIDEEGPSALERFHRRATALVQPRVARWRTIWQQTVAAETDATRAQLDALEAGRRGALGEAAVTRATPRDARGFGMCGRLTTWQWPTQAIEDGGVERRA